MEAACSTDDDLWLFWFVGSDLGLYYDSLCWITQILYKVYFKLFWQPDQTDTITPGSHC